MWKRRAIDPHRDRPECGRTVRKPGYRGLCQYRICKTQDHSVVYFADELDQQFETDVIRVLANFKLDADADPYPLCYCFGYDKRHVRADIEADGETNIDEWITERVQAEECACRWKSPLGGCCLANVRKAIDEAKTEVAVR